MNKTIQVSQLLNTPADTYVNGDVTGHLSNYKAPFKQGAPAKAKLQDETGFIDLSLWGAGTAHWDGKQVTLSGKGMKVTEYKGTPQLSVGDKVTISAGQEPDNIPGDPLPAPYRPAPQPAHTPHPVPASQPQAYIVGRQSPAQIPTFKLPNGAAVGGAVARAVEIMLAQDPAIFRQPGWDNTLHGIAAKIIAVQDALENARPLAGDGEVPF